MVTVMGKAKIEINLLASISSVCKDSALTISGRTVREVPPGVPCYKQGNRLSVEFLDAVASGKTVCVTGEFESHYDPITGRMCEPYMVLKSPEEWNNTDCLHRYLRDLEMAAEKAQEKFRRAKVNIHI